jgi:PRTRC genetic system protein F
MFLTLPRIAPTVPTSFVFGGVSERCTRLALAMTEEGLIRAEDVTSFRAPLAAADLRGVVQKAWQRQVGKRLNFGGLSTYATLVLADEPYSHDERADSKGIVEIRFSAAAPQEYFAERTIMALENHHPDLGRYALSTLDRALCMFGIPLTPEGAFYMAQNIYWHGEDNEDEVIAQYEAEGASTEDIVRRDVLFDGVPPWAYDFSRKPKDQVDTMKAESVIGSISDPVLASFLTHIVALDKQLNAANENELMPDTQADEDDYSECVEFMANLRWREDDSLGRVYDDHYNYAVQGETRDGMGFMRFPATQEGLRSGRARLDAVLNIFVSLDRALDIIKGY